MTTMPRILALAFLLPACTFEPPPGDASRDTSPSTDAQSASPDVRSVDVMDAVDVVDVAPDTSDAINAPTDDAADAIDAPTDTPIVADVADACVDACVENAIRCASGTGFLERCERVNGCLTWRYLDSCAPLTGERETCDATNGCLRCGVGDAGACPTSCTSNVECADRGLGRCVDGHCARRGFMACTTGFDCSAWNLGSAGAECNTRFFRGRPIQTCVGSQAVLPCVSDANCPPAFNGNPAWHCNASTGFCIR